VLWVSLDWKASTQRLDQLGDARASRSLCDQISFVLDRRQSIRDRDRLSACLQERVIVFGVAD
jgi:hypothetical protein